MGAEHIATKVLAMIALSSAYDWPVVALQTEKTMLKLNNVGQVDIVIRLVGGAILIILPLITSWAIWANPLMQFGALIVGAILMFTAAFRFCPLYRLFGLSTCTRS